MERRLARTMMNPAVNANHARMKWSGLYGAPVDRGQLLELEAQIAAIQAGNLNRPEAILSGHLESLDAVFYRLVGSAFDYQGNPMQEALMKLALRVQARATATARTLAELKNPRPPPVAYVQANIGNAVQVNNSGAVAPTENPPNKLLEQQRNEWMDARASSAAINADPAMAPVGAVDGAADGRR